MNPLEFLDNFSTDTWDRIGINRASGYQPDERTFTGNLITDYLKFKPDFLAIVPITQTNEVVTGADLDLWVRYRYYWARYLIQAKILNFLYQGYRKLDHKVKGIFQIETLINFSRQNKGIPLIGFYNHFDKNPEDYWMCNLPIVNPKFLGFTVSDGKEIFSSFGTRGFKKARVIHSRKSTVPTRCLLCCPAIRDIHPVRKSPINFVNYTDTLWEDERVPSVIKGILSKEVKTISSEMVSAIYHNVELAMPKAIVCADAEGQMRA